MEKHRVKFYSTSDLIYGYMANRVIEVLKALDENTDSYTLDDNDITNPEHAIKLNCDVAIMRDGKVIQCGKAKDCITRELLEKIYEIKLGELNE